MRCKDLSKIPIIFGKKSKIVFEERKRCIVSVISSSMQNFIEGYLMNYILARFKKKDKNTMFQS